MEAEKRCKHSLIEGQCALCLGMKQSPVRQYGDNPPWFRTLGTIGRWSVVRNLDSVVGHLGEE